jgi:hypothetical protein
MGETMNAIDLDDKEFRGLIYRMLELDEADFEDLDRRVLAAKILRLQAQIRELEAHHRGVHRHCTALDEGNEVERRVGGVMRGGLARQRSARGAA